MEKILTVTFVTSETEKNEINNIIHKLNEIKNELLTSKCENAKQSIEDTKELLLAIRDGNPIKVE